MSHVSHQELEFDFWEFVCCSRCQLPFNSNAGQSIPFWLTECGHVICNNHLSADQSCSKCGAQGIQLIPLQRDLDAPMSDWFRSIPYGLDGLAQAAKFQQETLSSQIRYYRARYQQQRVQLDRYKRDHEELMKLNQGLADENAQLRQQLGYDMNDGGMEPSNSVNANGKRPMAAVDPSLRYNEGMYANSTSSPRSAMTPNGPARLTLPRGQQPPTLTRQEHAGSDGTQSNRRQGFQDQRPRSSHPLAEQYAYQPPPTANRARPVATMAYSQTAPRMLQSNAHDDGNQQGSSSATMPPPGRFNPQPRSSKPAPQGASAQSRNRTHTGGPPGTSHAPNAAPTAPPFARAPPPSARAPPSSARPLPPVSARRPQNTSAPNSNRFMPPPPPGTVQRLGPGATPSANRRFVPPTPSRGRFVPAGVPGSARQPQRTMQGNGGGGGQRMPFVPGGG